MEHIVNVDSLSRVFEFCGVRDRRNMSCVSREFKEGFDVSRQACSILGLVRVRRLFSDKKHGAKMVFGYMNNYSMSSETMYIRGGGEFSYYIWEPERYMYRVLTFQTGLDGHINHGLWTQGSIIFHKGS